MWLLYEAYNKDTIYYIQLAYVKKREKYQLSLET